MGAACCVLIDLVMYYMRYFGIRSYLSFVSEPQKGHLNRLKHRYTVMPAKAERIAHGCFYFGLYGVF
jgi:hypothetical protein